MTSLQLYVYNLDWIELRGSTDWRKTGIKREGERDR